MRRSHKVNQPLQQHGTDESYKFRCMEYMNFVLDQIMSDDTKFKLYFSHIENLLRNNLNDLTIQDIQKVKRMLEEGEKTKPDIQETGEFINYDLLERQKYTHQRTRFYLEEGPAQALIYLQGFNEHTLQEVQITKLQHKLAKLDQKNYSLLDMMFKLPQDDKKIVQEAQKENQLKIPNIEGENQELVFENFNVQKDTLNQFPKENPQYPKVLPANNPENSIATTQLKETIQEGKNQHPAQSKLKQPALDKSIDLQFVQIKKKPKKKKTQTPSVEKISKPPIDPLPNVVDFKPEFSQAPHFIVQNPLPNIQPHQDQNIEKQKESENKNQDPEKKQNSEKEKRKYVRKKPLEPKPPKPEKEKPPKEPKKVQKEKFDDIVKKQKTQLEKIQSSVEEALLSQAAELSSLLGANLLAQKVQQNQKGSKITEELPLKDLMKKQSQTKKKKKVEGTIEPKQKEKSKEKSKEKQKEKSEGKKPKKQGNSKEQIEIQIVLPHPNCQEEVQKIKVDLHNLQQQLKESFKIFDENRVNLLTFIHPQHSETQKPEINETQKPETNETQKPEINEVPNLQVEQNFEVPEVEKMVFENHPIEANPQIQSQVQMSLQQIVPEIISTNQIELEKIEKEELKKAKSLLKQSSKKYQPSSEQYKPGQYQISQSDQNGDSKEGDYYQPGKDKKIKKKSKKKYKKQSNRLDKEKSKSKQAQKIQKISEEPAGKPSESLVSVDHQKKQKKNKLTPEQKQNKKILKEKQKELKEKIKQKQKQEKAKLKELERLQKQTLKLKKLQKSQKSSKSQKFSQKQRNNSISQVNESSSMVMLSHEERREALSLQIFNPQIQVYPESQIIPGQSQKKNPLNITITSNSTKEELSLSFVSIVGAQKSLVEEMVLEPQPLPIIEESQKIEADRFEDSEINEQDIGEKQQPVIVGIPANGSFSAFFQEHIASWDESAKNHQHILSGSPKRQKSHASLQSKEMAQVQEIPKKKIKLSFKESYVFQDPQYGIQNPPEEKELYTVQVFERSPSRNVSQNQQAQQDQKRDEILQGEQFLEGNFSKKVQDISWKNEEARYPQGQNEFDENSSSLSADDD